MYSDETQKRVMQRMEELGKLDDRKHLRAVYMNGRLRARQSENNKKRQWRKKYGVKNLEMDG